MWECTTFKVLRRRNMVEDAASLACRRPMARSKSAHKGGSSLRGAAIFKAPLGEWGLHEDVQDLECRKVCHVPKV